MNGTPLRMVERARLRHLAALGAPDPGIRAEAAMKVAALVQRKGLDWPALIPAVEVGVTADVTPPPDWRAEVVALLARPDLDPVDRVFLHKLAGWRAPGADGLRRLREIGGQS